jgi:catechol 2,3-dioxygenase-like lactoylglutathione lyase family enzyme
MPPKIDAITLGVKDLAQARRFYEHGFGGDIREESQALVVSLGPNASRLVLRPWETAASEAGVEENTSGFRAFTLSLILTAADDVDRILERAASHGGRVAKPPKAAFWGYSAYVTDPSGYLWKIASAKRRRLIGRNEPSINDGHAIKPQEAPITIGVADMKRAKEFYRDGLGMPVKKSFGNKFVLFGGQDGTSDLGMYKREALADDAAVNPEGSGFRGFSITHVVDSAERVDALLASAARAGGEIVKSPTGAAQGRYGGYFADLDGNLWQIANRD